MCAQGLRAYAYGFTAILLGHLLAQRNTSALGVGLLLTSIVLGAGISSVLLMRFGDKFGRRKSYLVIYILMSVAWLGIAIHSSLWTIALVGLTGVLSTDANDNGPATTLEQAMLAQQSHVSKLSQIFGKYNGIAAIFGSLGALSQGWFSQFGRFNTTFIGYLVLIPVGIACACLAAGLTPAVERAEKQIHIEISKSSPVRRRIYELSALFSWDAAAGGLTTSAWLSYYLTHRYHASASTLGFLFFAFSVLQAMSMFLAPLVAKVIGLVFTMVFTHVASNVFLIVAAFCGNFKIAIIFLLLRASLSQMDIPTRQALVMAVVPESDRMAASALTNAARYAVRPLSPTIGAIATHLALYTPLVLSGAMKVIYDGAILLWAKRGGFLEL